VSSDGGYVRSSRRPRPICRTRCVPGPGWYRIGAGGSPVGRLNLDGIDWVIVGGESGPRARPMDPEWVREVDAVKVEPADRADQGFDGQEPDAGRRLAQMADT
jgi:hypothetical protein